MIDIKALLTSQLKLLKVIQTLKILNAICLVGKIIKSQNS